MVCIYYIEEILMTDAKAKAPKKSAATNKLEEFLKTYDEKKATSDLIRVVQIAEELAGEVKVTSRALKTDKEKFGSIKRGTINLDDRHRAIMVDLVGERKASESVDEKRSLLDSESCMTGVRRKWAEKYIAQDGWGKVIRLATETGLNINDVAQAFVMVATLAYAQEKKIDMEANPLAIFGFSEDLKADTYIKFHPELKRPWTNDVNYVNTMFTWAQQLLGFASPPFVTAVLVLGTYVVRGAWVGAKKGSFWEGLKTFGYNNQGEFSYARVLGFVLPTIVVGLSARFGIRVSDLPASLTTAPTSELDRAAKCGIPIDPETGSCAIGTVKAYLDQVGKIITDTVNDIQRATWITGIASFCVPMVTKAFRSIFGDTGETVDELIDRLP